MVTPNLDVLYQRKENQRKKTTKRCDRYYNNDDKDDFNGEIDVTPESGEESKNFDDNENDINYKKKAKQITE